MTPGENRSPGGSNMKRMKRPFQVRIFKVELSFAGTVPMDSIARVIRGLESENYEEAIQVLDIILRQTQRRSNIYCQELIIQLEICIHVTLFYLYQYHMK